MFHTMTMTIYPKSIPVNVTIMLNVFPDTDRELGDFEIEYIRSNNQEYDFNELSVDDQNEIKLSAQDIANHLMYEAAAERSEREIDDAYDSWIDSQE